MNDNFIKEFLKLLQQKAKFGLAGDFDNEYWVSISDIKKILDNLNE